MSTDLKRLSGRTSAVASKKITPKSTPLKKSSSSSSSSFSSSYSSSSSLSSYSSSSSSSSHSSSHSSLSSHLPPSSQIQSSVKRKKELAEELSANHLIKSLMNDSDSSDLENLYSTYGYAQSDTVIEATRAALVAKTHKCTVLPDAESALQFLLSLPLSSSSLFCTGSTTLKEIGFLQYLKEHKDVCRRNIKTEVIAAKKKGDAKAVVALTREGMCADYVFSSIPALSAQGDIIVCCTTGSRTGCFNYAAKNLILVVGSNKIVDTYEECLTRMNDYVVPLENARLDTLSRRKKSGGPGATAAPNFFASIRSGNPFGRKGRIHVVLVKQPLGF